MRILFLSHYFPPEVNAPAVRTFEHCREWVKAGHEVHVITCVPSHPAGVAFEGYRSGWYRRETHEGIVVHRVWTWLAANEGILKRTANFLSFVPSAVWRAMRLGSFDVVVGTSPQFFCAVAAWIAASAKKTPWVFELRDLWPESIAAVGAKRRYMPMALLERLELHLYARAAAVVCLSQSFMRNLTARGIAPSKLSYVPNGIETSFWSAGSRARGRAALGIDERSFVVSYVGTVGMAHDLGTVLAAARRLKHERPDVRFLIVGDGAERQMLTARAVAEDLDNVTFTGLVQRERVPDYLAASDVSLVTLKRSDLFKTVLPSKMFEAMAAARPVVLAVEGEARQVLDRAAAGLAVAPGEPDALVDAVIRLAGDPALCRTMGLAGRRFVDREFSRGVWADRYLDVLVPASRRTSAPPVGQPDASPTV
jgi:glycosyltransferase involved in cell wall biosynthesis